MSIINKIFILITSTVIVSCAGLEKGKALDIEETCATSKPHFSCPLKPLKSIRAFVRKFERIKHKYELSLINGSEYNLISQLKHLYKDIIRQKKIFNHNWNILSSRFDRYNSLWLSRNPNERIFLRNKAKDYTNYASEFKDLKHNMLILIEKLIAIKKLSNTIKFQKERKEKTLKALKVYSI